MLNFQKVGDDHIASNGDQYFRITHFNGTDSYVLRYRPDKHSPLQVEGEWLAEDGGLSRAMDRANVLAGFSKAGGPVTFSDMTIKVDDQIPASTVFTVPKFTLPATAPVVKPIPKDSAEAMRQQLLEQAAAGLEEMERRENKAILKKKEAQ